jgi:hypothetical protein
MTQQLLYRVRLVVDNGQGQLETVERHVAALPTEQRDGKNAALVKMRDQLGIYPPHVFDISIELIDTVIV